MPEPHIVGAIFCGILAFIALIFMVREFEQTTPKDENNG